jgi:hypothetical protein
LSSPSADPDRRGTIRRTGGSALAIFASAGLIAGWSYHYLKRLNSGLDPTLSWPVAGITFFLAAFVAIAALRTHQARRAQLRLPAHRAVNLLVLGKTCARAGAAVVGAYVGFALGYLRPSMSVPAHQLVLVGLTCMGGVALMLSGLALERSCEIKPDAGADADA